MKRFCGLAVLLTMLAVAALVDHTRATSPPGASVDLEPVDALRIPAPREADAKRTSTGFVCRAVVSSHRPFVDDREAAAGRSWKKRRWAYAHWQAGRKPSDRNHHS